MKKVKVCMMVLVVGVLAAGTIFEKYRGAGWVGDHYYGSWWFAVLMALTALSAIVAIVKDKLYNRPEKLLVYVAVPLILLGGALTTWVGQHGHMTLAQGETSSLFATDAADTLPLPFAVTLESFEVVNYPGTHTPMDFVSHISACGDSFDISMNHIYRRDGYRFYQEDYDEEGRSTLSVSHDPWGIAVTYCGYALLLLGLLWIARKRYRSLVPPAASEARGGRKPLVAALLLAMLLPVAVHAAPQTLPRQTASAMGEMYVLYKGRICPLQTFAKDFTTKLTGKATYEGLTPEQFLSGFLFYYSEWEDFAQQVSPKRRTESENLVQMLVSGRGLKLYPVADSSGSVGWYAQNDALPLCVGDDEYIFIRKQLGYCQQLVVSGDYAGLEEVFAKTRLFQEKVAAEVLPSPARVKAERVYNALTTGRWLAMLGITLGLLFFAYAIYCMGRGIESPRVLRWLSVLWVALLTAFLLLLFALRWVVGGHVPMAGGFDSMNLMAIAIGLLGLALSRRHTTALPVAMLTMGFCLLVAMMSGSNPPVTSLMPVLSSPLLCLHVAVVLMAYALFFFLMMSGIAGLALGRHPDVVARLHSLGLLLLYPAVFLLALGIVIGALWANISWGNYWTWDPKEVWALITLIVYSLPLHPSLRINSSPRAFSVYCTLAFISVLVTYFGVNLILGGIHAYN